jgi:hypothetical protein
MAEKSMHERIIDDACARDGWQRRGWRIAIAKAFDDPSWAGEYAEDVEPAEWVWPLFRDLSRVPDAWRIRFEGKEHGWGHPVMVIEFLEVEISHPMGERKEHDYIAIWSALDDTDFYHFRVFRRFWTDPMHLWLGEVTHPAQHTPAA